MPVEVGGEGQGVGKRNHHGRKGGWEEGKRENHKYWDICTIFQIWTLVVAVGSRKRSREMFRKMYQGDLLTGRESGEEGKYKIHASDMRNQGAEETFTLLRLTGGGKSFKGVDRLGHNEFSKLEPSMDLGSSLSPGLER